MAAMETQHATSKTTQVTRHTCEVMCQSLQVTRQKTPALTQQALFSLGRRTDIHNLQRKDLGDVDVNDDDDDDDSLKRTMR